MLCWERHIAAATSWRLEIRHACQRYCLVRFPRVSDNTKDTPRDVCLTAWLACRQVGRKSLLSFNPTTYISLAEGIKPENFRRPLFFSILSSRSTLVTLITHFKSCDSISCILAAVQGTAVRFVMWTRHRKRVQFHGKAMHHEGAAGLI